jgi:NAD-dependent oxidoreductase involved in siderophore biosynthesis
MRHYLSLALGILLGYLVYLLHQAAHRRQQQLPAPRNRLKGKNGAATKRSQGKEYTLNTYLHQQETIRTFLHYHEQDKTPRLQPGIHPPRITTVKKMQPLLDTLAMMALVRWVEAEKVYAV